MSITPTSRTPHFCHEGVMLLVVGASCLHWDLYKLVRLNKVHKLYRLYKLCKL